MTVPGTILLSKIFVPETEQPETAGNVALDIPTVDANLIGAAARGTGKGCTWRSMWARCSSRFWP